MIKTCITANTVMHARLSKKWLHHFFEFFARRRVTRLRREKYFLRRTRRRRKWFHFLSRLREKLGETFFDRLTCITANTVMHVF